ncbi:TIR domain-containing protein [Porphyromonas macacae]|uniref:TIR domain-containing protein n=1 Tax=Porphyromonas macacae TaxID=28115 RepID=UPI003D15D9E3
MRSCCFDLSDIIYTSRETTGVEPGEGIPSFIKENLKTSSLVLFLISDNYKSSEVCLNEMGAAWALEKNTISILLPGTTFKSLGWLTSLSKALKIDDSEGLDKIYSIFNRKDANILDWNRQKESFMDYCKNWRGKANESYP